MTTMVKGDQEFYGVTVLGERGQIVVPADARNAMALKKGHKLLVFGMGKGVLALATLSSMKEFQSRMHKRLKSINKVIKKNK